MLTLLRLDEPPTLARALRSTNAAESMISISQHHARNVKRSWTVLSGALDEDVGVIDHEDGVGV